MRRRNLLRVGAAVTLGSILPSAPRAAGAIGDRPNILIILADDMGYSDPGFMGGEAHTPNLDRLARSGTLFTNCFNNAKCAPTRASLMTGLYNQRSGAHRSAGNLVEGGGACLAELMKAGGYATILAGKWHIKPDPLECGFERHFGSLLTPLYFKPRDEKDVIRIERERYDAPDDFYSTIAYTDYAIRAVREESLQKKKPFFLYLAYHAPHWPLHALPEDIAKYRGRYDEGTDAMRQARYQRMVELGIVDPKTWKLPELEPGVPHWKDLAPEDQKRMATKLAIHAAMVDRMDREIGRLLDFLKESGQFGNTLIFFLSDNGACAEGGMLGDGYEQKTGLHGELGTDESFPAVGTHGAGALNTPLRKYKTTLYEGGCRTPLVIHWPGRIAEPGRMSRESAHAFDIMPTCLEAAGIGYPAEFSGKKLHALDGVSLTPALSGESLGDRLLCWNFKEAGSARNSRWKLIGQTKAAGKREKPWELYDVANDQSETLDVAAQRPEVVKELSAKWDAWNEDVKAVEGYQNYVARKGTKGRRGEEE